MSEIRIEDYRCCPDCLFDWDECECDEYDDDDHQPSEYDEWQDYYGGQYDHCEDW